MHNIRVCRSPSLSSFSVCPCDPFFNSRRQAHKSIPGSRRRPRQIRSMTSSAAAILYAATVATPDTQRAQPDDAYAKNKSHHKPEGGFTNPWDSYKFEGGWKIGRTLLSRKFNGKGNTPDTTPPTVPVRKPVFLPERKTDQLRATWLGHACYYVEFPGGLRVLFDPVFTHRCSPFSWLGPKRYTEMPCQIEDIPFIDVVVISHNHYDHRTANLRLGPQYSLIWGSFTSYCQQNRAVAPELPLPRAFGKQEMVRGQRNP